MFCSGPFQRRNNPQDGLVKVTGKRTRTIPPPRGPQITPELEMRKRCFAPGSVFIRRGAESAFFSSKAKLWSLWSVGHVAEEMLIMWLCASLVCCDLEGSSHGAMGLCGTRGVTTGSAPGRGGKKVTKHCQTVHFLPSSGRAYTNTFPVSQGSDTHYTVSLSVWLRLNLLSSSCPSQLCLFCGGTAGLLFSLYVHTTISVTNPQGPTQSKSILQSQICTCVHILDSVNSTHELDARTHSLPPCELMGNRGLE